MLYKNISKFVRKHLQYVPCRSSARNLFHLQFHFLGFFLYIRNTNLQEHLRVFVIYFFYCNVSSKNLLSLFLYFFKKSDAPYLFPANWLLLIVIDKFTIVFAPFSLVTKGAFATIGRICLCVKSHSFFFSLIQCCPLPFKTECLIPFIFRLAVVTYFAD